MQSRVVILLGATAFFAFALIRVGIRNASPGRTTVSARAQALIACDESPFNFGRKFIGATIEHVFWIRNASDTEVVISDVRPGCSCTTTSLEEKVVKPHGSVPLKVTVSLDSQRGDVEFHVTVTLSQPEQSSLSLVMLGHVDSEFTITPHAFAFGESIQGDQLRGAVEIKAIGDTSFELLSVECESPLCRASHECLEEGKSYRLSVHVAERLPLGLWKSRVIARTSNPKEPIVKITVATHVRAKATFDDDTDRKQERIEPKAIEESS